MSEIAFLRTHRHKAEHSFGGEGFGDVAFFGGGAVPAHIAHLFGADTCVFEGEFHAFLHGVFLRLGNVAAIAVCAVADDFGVDFGTARPRVFQRFQHQHARAFADDEAVGGAARTGRARGPRIIRARGKIRFAVAAAGGVERVKHIHFRRAELFAAACKHGVNQPVFDGFVGVADGLAA